MPISNPAEREQDFGPDSVAVLAVALEDTLRQLRLVNPARAPREGGDVRRAISRVSNEGQPEQPWRAK